LVLEFSLIVNAYNRMQQTVAVLNSQDLVKVYNTGSGAFYTSGKITV